jgi:hypothetical protein
MRTQGKVLSVPNVAPGLIMIQGRQFKFSGNTAWKSKVWIVICRWLRSHRFLNRNSTGNRQNRQSIDRRSAS